MIPMNPKPTVLSLALASLALSSGTILVVTSMSQAGCGSSQPAPQNTTVAAHTTAGTAGAMAGPAASAAPVEIPAAPSLPPLPAGLTALTNVPADNATTPEKAFLGNQLFHDKRLSVNENMSCATCHEADKAWTDGRARAVDHAGKQMPRNTPSLYNIGYREALYWDGRSPNLETQALLPTKAFMGFADPAPLIERLNKIRGYRQQFESIFAAKEISADLVRRAIAAYERTVLAANSAYDRYQAGDHSALTKNQQQGLKLFTGKAGCGGCHSGPLLSDGQYHDIGVDWGREGVEPDPGRFNATKNEEDRGKFRTPSLRDVAKTAPFFHDGSAATLEAAVDFVLGGGHAQGNKNFDTKNLHRVTLRPPERQALLEFLNALSSETTPSDQTPWLPP